MTLVQNIGQKITRCFHRRGEKTIYNWVVSCRATNNNIRAPLVNRFQNAVSRMHYKKI